MANHYQRWLRTAMIFAIVYPVVGITFAALAKQVRHDNDRP